MTVSIHQPHFLPWLGYFNKVFNSEAFVWLHNVQFRKNYFQNRTKIKNPFDEKEAWLTIPVKAKLGEPIDRVKIADARWADKASKTILQFYRKAPHFDLYFDKLVGQFANSDSLEAVNYTTFFFLLKELGYPGKLIRMEELNVTAVDPNERLIEICKKLGSTHYIAGKGGKNYLDQQKWQEAGISVSWQAFDPDALSYHQLGNHFLPSLSVIDSLFNIGADQTRELVIGAWKVDN
jgi:hypothetical protein